MAIEPRPSRPSARRLPSLPAIALATLFVAVLAAPLALTGCGGTTDPVSRPETAPGAAAPQPAEPAVESMPEMTDEAPVNASPTARVRPPRTPPPPPEVEPRSEWTIDESIATPEELEKLEILAKFRKGDDVVIIYRAKNGDVYRRVEGQLGAYRRVEESRIELEP